MHTALVLKCPRTCIAQVCALRPVMHITAGGLTLLAQVSPCHMQPPILAHLKCCVSAYIAQGLFIASLLAFHFSQENGGALKTRIKSSVLASWRETEARAETWLLQAQLVPSPASTVAAELSRFLHTLIVSVHRLLGEMWTLPDILR